MLTIREDQMQAFSSAQEKRFAESLVDYARKEFPEETSDVPYEDIREIARLAVEKTKKYGITERVDICFNQEYAGPI